RRFGHVGAQFLRERAIMLGPRAELFAVGRDFAVDPRRAHARPMPVGRKSPDARLAAAAGVGKAVERPNMNRSILIAVASAFALAACSNLTGNHAEGQPGTEAGINTAWMDKAVTPGDDFYSYADGTWM